MAVELVQLPGLLVTEVATAHKDKISQNTYSCRIGHQMQREQACTSKLHDNIAQQCIA